MVLIVVITVEDIINNLLEPLLEYHRTNNRFQSAYYFVLIGLLLLGQYDTEYFQYVDINKCTQNREQSNLDRIPVWFAYM